MNLTSYLQPIGPRFFIKANGELAEDIVSDIVSFEYADDAKKSDQLTIQVANVGLKYSDDPRFKEGVIFNCRWGYLGDVSDLKKVIIVRAKPSVGADIPMLTCVAFDLRRDMNRGADSKNWGPISSSAVAYAIANKYRLRTDIEASGDERDQSRIQSAQLTDIQFLMKLAEPLDWEAYVDGETLHFHPKRLEAAPAFTFTYYKNQVSDVLSFDPEVKMEKPSQTGKSASSTKDGTDTSSSSKSGDKRLGSYEVDTTTGALRFVPPTVGPIYGTTPETDQRVVKKHAAAQQGKIDMNAITATMTVVGTPRLKARQVIRLEGVGKTYSGVWYVASTRHRIDPSGTVYQVTCKLQRNALDRGKKKNKTSDNQNNQKGTKEEKDYTAYFRVDTREGRLDFSP